MSKVIIQRTEQFRIELDISTIENYVVIIIIQGQKPSMEIYTPFVVIW